VTGGGSEEVKEVEKVQEKKGGEFREETQRTRTRRQAEACATWEEMSVGYGDVVAGG
jgi:hypothetical protein